MNKTGFKKGDLVWLRLVGTNKKQLKRVTKVTGYVVWANALGKNSHDNVGHYPHLYKKATKLEAIKDALKR